MNGKQAIIRTFDDKVYFLCLFDIPFFSEVTHVKRELMTLKTYSYHVHTRNLQTNRKHTYMCFEVMIYGFKKWSVPMKWIMVILIASVMCTKHG